MNPMNLLAVTSGTAALLLWLALAGILASAVVLYWPRRFSGPLTDQERRLVRRVLRGRSLALTLATPVSTIVGFVLLLPPLVHLAVGDGRRISEAPSCIDVRHSRMSVVAWTQSTTPWVEAVECNAPPDASPEELAATIVETAAGGFERSRSCDWRRLSPLDRASVELSLVELAARAYTLTEVDLDPGPRHTDPDPWDIMKRTLDARGIPACRDADEAPAGEGEGEGELIRLSSAFVASGPGNHLLEVSAVARGRLCDRSISGKLLSSKGDVLAQCELVTHPGQCAADGQRVVGMWVTCGDMTAARLRELGRRSGLILSAGYDQARVYLDLPVKLEIDDAHLKQTFIAACNLTHFRDSLRQHGFQVPAKCEDFSEPSVLVRSADGGIVIERKDASPSGSTAWEALSRPEPRRGPFSWQGVRGDDKMRIRCSEERILIDGANEFLKDSGAPRDPTVLFPLMSTIVWAANVLTNSTCSEIVGETVDPVGSRPLLTAEQLEEAVAGMGRSREMLGLVCLGFALGALALGLRRSVT